MLGALSRLRTRSESLNLVGLGVVVFVSVVLASLAVLNVFYTSGDVTDPGWLASIAWHNTWKLQGPPGFPRSYFYEHISPIFWLTNIASYALPLAKFDFYALCIGAVYALFAAGVYRLWQMGDGPEQTPWKIFVAVVVALAATFGAVGMQLLQVPHHEIAIPAFALWFCMALAERNHRQASVWFVLCLLVREDAGFHLFGLLILWWMAENFSGRLRTDAKKLLGFAGAALAYSGATFALRSFLSVKPTAFERNYSGIPAWAHVNAAMLYDQLHFYAIERFYAYLPLLVTMVWAVVARNLLLPLGYLAFLPWLLLNFFAAGQFTAKLSLYYAFPFWLALAWPLLALQIGKVESPRAAVRWPYVLVLLSSIISWNGGHLNFSVLASNEFDEHPFVLSQAVKHRKAADHFVDYFVANKASFQNIPFAVDLAVHGLLIDYVGRENWLGYLWDKQRVPDIIFYYANGYEGAGHVLPLLQSGHYNHFYIVENTPIRIAASLDLSAQFPKPSPWQEVAVAIP